MLDTPQDTFSPVSTNPLHLFSHPAEESSYNELPESVYHAILLEFCKANLQVSKHCMSSTGGIDSDIQHSLVTYHQIHINQQ